MSIKNESPFRYVYGPVPSKRLGRSLGVDLAPFKRCTYDCIYCQLGRTTELTAEIKPYGEVEAICAEVKRKLAGSPPPDVISLAGSGEPTLNAGLGSIVEGIKGITTIPLAVLTNGSLLGREEVRKALAAVDLVLPSLDAGDEAIFRTVNRPHPDIGFEAMIDGLVGFSQAYRGRLWIEVFLLAGLTALPREIAKIDAILHRIRADRIQLNTLTRPPAEPQAGAVSDEAMARCRSLFSHPVEIIGRGPARPVTGSTGPAEAEILALLRRRPCTLADVAAGLDIQPGEALKLLDGLNREGAVTLHRRQEGLFYQAPKAS